MIVTIEDENDIDIDIDSDPSLSSYDHNHDLPTTTIQLCHNNHRHRHRPYNHHHPCTRTETLDECDGGALPPLQSVRRNIQDYENNEIRVKRQHIINRIVHDMKRIHHHHNREQQQQQPPMQFISPQYICIGQ